MSATPIPDQLSDTLVRVKSFAFVENGAGTYTGRFTMPANAVLLDVTIHAEALWTAATSAIMKVGDTVDDDGIAIGVDLKATDLLANESLSLYQLGGKQGADIGDAATPGTQMSRRSLTTSRTLGAIVTSVGAGTAGRTRVDFVYSVAVPIVVTQ